MHVPFRFVAFVAVTVCVATTIMHVLFAIEHAACIAQATARK